MCKTNVEELLSGLLNQISNSNFFVISDHDIIKTITNPVGKLLIVKLFRLTIFSRRNIIKQAPNNSCYPSALNRDILRSGFFLFCN